MDSVGRRRSLLLCAGAAGAIAIASLGTAGTANASCAAAGYLSVGQGCEADGFGDVAIAIGPGSMATAGGGFNASIAIGSQAYAVAGGGSFNRALAIGTLAIASASSNSTAAVAIGEPGYNPGLGADTPTTATVHGARSRAFALGDATIAHAGRDQGGDPRDQRNNSALAIGKGSAAGAVSPTGTGRLSNHIGIATRGRVARNGINNGI